MLHLRSAQSYFTTNKGNLQVLCRILKEFSPSGQDGEIIQRFNRLFLISSKKVRVVPMAQEGT